MKPETFWSVLKAHGYTFFSGVPCSILKPILELGLKDPAIEYLPAVRENVALGLASGAWLGGRKSGILMQNSGLGNIINALSSFNLIYAVPVLLLVTWRGQEGLDAPEHWIMGDKMLGLLKLFELPTFILGARGRETMEKALATLEEKAVPVAVVIPKGMVA